MCALFTLTCMYYIQNQIQPTYIMYIVVSYIVQSCTSVYTLHVSLTGRCRPTAGIILQILLLVISTKSFPLSVWVSLGRCVRIVFLICKLWNCYQHTLYIPIYTIWSSSECPHRPCEGIWSCLLTSLNWFRFTANIPKLNYTAQKEL